MQAAKRVLRYLKSSPGQGVILNSNYATTMIGQDVRLEGNTPLGFVFS